MIVIFVEDDIQNECVCECSEKSSNVAPQTSSYSGESDYREYRFSNY